VLSALRATTQRSGSAVLVSVGGEVDASNEDVWRALLTKMAAAAIATDPFVVDVRNLRAMGCGAMFVLAQQARRCRRGGVNLRLGLQSADRGPNRGRRRIVPAVVDASEVEALTATTAEPRR
jgi:anti-anti-sigma factor